jgi:hypothetical protein
LIYQMILGLFVIYRSMYIFIWVVT